MRLRLAGILPKFSIAKEVSMTSCPIKFQQDLKKMGDIPPGLKVVKGFICFRENSTSPAVYSLVRSAFMAEVIFVSMPWRI